VGLCWSGVRRVQNAIGRPPNWVNQLSSSDWVVSWGRPLICSTLLRSDKKARTSALASIGLVRTSGCSCGGCDLWMRPRSTRASVTASSIARLGEAGASACKWNGRLCFMGAEDWTGSTSSAAHMLARELGPNGKDSGWCCCQRWYSVRRSYVRECWRYGGSTTALSRASRGSWTRKSHESRVTKENSRFFGSRCSWAKLSKRLMASRKDPAVRTCSQVKVVRLATSSLSYLRVLIWHKVVAL